MNILITAIGSLSATAVIGSLKGDGHTLVGCDIYPQEWVYNARLVDRFFQAPKCSDSTPYINFINRLCAEHSIDFILPLTDPEVDVLAQFRHLINPGSQLALSPNAALNLCRDKLSWFELLRCKAGLRLIPTVLLHDFVPGTLRLPLIAKPRNGRSSEGIYRLDTAADIAWLKQKIPAEQFIIQPLLSGPVFVVDVVRTAKGQAVAVARQELLRTANGAGLTIQIIENPALIKTALEIADQLGIQGCINLEFLGTDDGFYLMDINPRFSAGVEFSQMAGYDMVINHLNNFIHQEIQPAFNCKPGIFTRHYVAEEQYRGHHEQ
ncbi:ATP-grasp domain-containing protein [Erwinia sp. E_sp_B04_7]|uniref:ATP-grasp domain-containing protein n=1 Tax=unclassified Erwinia TaxID=2622719 RepID=UPI0030CD5313